MLLQAVFVSMDQGVEKELGADQGKYVVLPSILDKVPSAVPVVVAAYANDTAPGVAALPIKLFGGGERRVANDLYRRSCVRSLCRSACCHRCVTHNAARLPSSWWSV